MRFLTRIFKKAEARDSGGDSAHAGARTVAEQAMALAADEASDSRFAIRLFELFTAFEADVLHVDHYAASHFLISEVFGDDRRATLVERLARLEVQTADLPLLVAQVGCLWRLSGEGDAAFQALLGAHKAGETAALDAVLQFELCQIFWIHNAWPQLRAQAEKLAGQPETTPRHRQYCCDFAVLATYRPLQPRILADKATKAEVEDLMALMVRFRAVLGQECRNSLIYTAIEACLRGDYEDAITAFCSSQEAPGHIHTAFRTSEAVMPLDALQALGQGAHWREGHCMPRIRHKDHTFAHILSCDRTYFDNFFAPFAEAYGQLNPGRVLHLHCVNFTLPEDELKALEARYGIALNVTDDRQDGLEGNVDLYRGYAASARYIYLPRYLELYGAVAITDVDGRPAIGVPDLLDALGAGILIKSKLTLARAFRPVLWSAIWAGTFATANTPANMRFAETLSAYLLYRLADSRASGRKFFFADQVGLMLCYLLYRDACTFAEVPRLYEQADFKHFGVVKNQAGIAGKASK